MGAGNKPVPEAVRAEAQSFIHRVEYSGEGGVCAAHIRVQGQGPQAELSTAPEHQVPGRWHTPARVHREHSTASQKLLNICFRITRGGEEGRKSG